MFDPGKPDGNNQSLKIGISNDGTPKLNFTYKIPARCGIAVKLKIKLILPKDGEFQQFMQLLKWKKAIKKEQKNYTQKLWILDW